MKNISAVEVSDTSLTTDTKLEDLLENSISIWFSKDTEPFEVKLYATKNAAKYFKCRKLPTQKILSLNKDNSMEFSVIITNEIVEGDVVEYINNNETL